ncbi:hypothetical protein BSKO_06311 [Bryopsis sp. KO-2023]|nr:hypothetical protein BSKO_06311 [Bryopsis sp. KO-2023]
MPPPTQAKPMEGMAKAPDPQGCKKKKKKQADLDGRKVESAYFAKTIDEDRNSKNPFQKFGDSILSGLPNDAQMNLRRAGRGIGSAVGGVRDAIGGALSSFVVKK